MSNTTELQTSWVVDRCSPGSWLVCAGANPREKVIHDSNFGHYGVGFATVSFEHEYSHDVACGARFAAQYAAVLSAVPEMVGTLLTGREELGPWLSAALDDDAVAPEFKAAIRKWMESTDEALRKASAQIGVAA